MVKAEIGYEQIRKMIQKLPMRQKVKLASELNQETWKNRFKEIMKNIDTRLKKHPISQNEIDQLIEESKEEYHAKSRR